MSQSPGKAEGVSLSDVRDYLAGREELTRLLREGMSWSGNERHCAFLNTGGPRFATISAVSGLDFPADGRAVVVSDWDGDGDLDMWLASRTAPRLRFMLNRTPSDNHHLAVRLVGRTCNRDAIGARLELELAGSGPRPIRTLRAGDGFLSQSSKWVQFGLGKASRIEKLIVRWPGGAAEEFLDLRADRRYLIEQGGRATEVPETRKHPPALVPGAPPVPEPSDRGRVFLASPVPAPPLRYEDFEGRPTPAGTALASGPLLVNLWASWCAPCVHELTEFTRHEQAIREAGLGILALSLDGLDEDDLTDPAKARALLETLSYPFEAGVATADLLDMLDRLQREIVSKPLPLPIPTSFLIDREGMLAAIYRGPVPVEQLIADVAALGTPGKKRLRMAIPHPGRMHHFELPDPFDPIDAVAKAWFTSGHEDEAVGLYRHMARMRPEDPEALQRLAASLARRGNFEEARRRFGEALRLDPGFTAARIGLAHLMTEAGRIQEAMSQYREVLRADPDSTTAHINLGVALARQGRIDEAMSEYESALAIEPENTSALNNLAMALVQLGRAEEAVDIFRRLVAIAPDNAIAHLTPSSHIVPDLYFNLAGLLFNRGNFAEAGEAYARAVGLSPEDPQLHHALGLSRMMEGRTAEAVKSLREAARLSPSDPTILSDLAEALGVGGAFSEAMHRHRSAIDLAPNNPYFRMQYAATLARMGRFGEAAAAAERAATMAPGETEILVRLAGYRTRSGDRDGALAALKRAIGAGFHDAARLRRDPHFAPLHDDPEFRELVTRLGR